MILGIYANFENDEPSMSFEPIKRIVNRSMKSAPIAKELQIARVFDGWGTVLLHTWGEGRARYISPISFREGVLTVASSSPTAQQQLTIDRIQLQNALNRHLGEFLVRSIVVRSKGF